jgi:hypothetical protein
MKLNLPNECDNSPKRKLIQDLFLSFVKCDYTSIYAHFAEDITWEIVGDQKLSKKDDIHQFLEHQRVRQVQEIFIDYVLTHGKFGAVGGKIVLTDQIIHFADFYEFTSAASKVLNKIRSFVIQQPKPIR